MSFAMVTCSSVIPFSLCLSRASVNSSGWWIPNYISVEGKKYLLTHGKVDDVVDGDVDGDPLGPRQLLVLPLSLGLERCRGWGGVGVVWVPPGVAGLEVVGGVVRVVAAIAVQRVAVGGGGEGLQLSVLLLYQHLLWNHYIQLNVVKEKVKVYSYQHIVPESNHYFLWRSMAREAHLEYSSLHKLHS